MIGAQLAGLYGDGVAASTTAYESIATVTVGAGGSSTVTFNSIPSTYKHLQIRYIAKSTTSGTDTDGLYVQLNGDTTYTNYWTHWLYGTGSAVGALGVSQASWPAYNAASIAKNQTNMFGVGIIDILDYANTSKNKTMRTLEGSDFNDTNGVVGLTSGSWSNTSAITSITLKSSANNLGQYSSFALYGIKG